MTRASPFLQLEASEPGRSVRSPVGHNPLEMFLIKGFVLGGKQEGRDNMPYLNMSSLAIYSASQWMLVVCHPGRRGCGQYLENVVSIILAFRNNPMLQHTQQNQFCISLLVHWPLYFSHVSGYSEADAASSKWTDEYLSKELEFYGRYNVMRSGQHSTLHRAFDPQTARLETRDWSCLKYWLGVIVDAGFLFVLQSMSQCSRYMRVLGHTLFCLSMCNLWCPLLPLQILTASCFGMRTLRVTRRSGHLQRSQ